MPISTFLLGIGPAAVAILALGVAAIAIGTLVNRACRESHYS